MVKITISAELSVLIPELSLSCIECDVMVQQSDDDLQEKIRTKASLLSGTLKMEEISRLPAIQASRKAYRACGKDPARYRLSSEALLRRIVKGSDIYRISNVVDLLNLVSFSTGFSIGGYDAPKIRGNVVFGIGRVDETYEGVGRGILNIEGLPVFRDDDGAFGSPTSDSERTAVTDQTSRFLMIIIGFGGNEGPGRATDFAVELLKNHASAKNFELQLITI